MSATAPGAFDFLSSGATPEVAPGPIGGAAAWRGQELATQQASWTHQLTDGELDELDAAMRRTRHLEFQQITAERFVLPTLGAGLHEICRELLHGRGFVLIRGVPVGEYTLEESARIYWGLSSYIGHARSQNAKGHLLGHVCNLGEQFDAFGNPGKVRVYQTRVRQKFHLTLQ